MCVLGVVESMPVSRSEVYYVQTSPEVFQTDPSAQAAELIICQSHFQWLLKVCVRLAWQHNKQPVHAFQIMTFHL